ncbi:CotH kinase family protein [bacterium]|nr:CotH kinase family protein [bacterium]
MALKSLSIICQLMLVVVPAGMLGGIDFTSSNLPIVVIDTDGETIPDEPKITVHMGIIDNGPGNRNHLTDPFNGYDGLIGIEIRGSSSQTWPKKQYGFETRDDSDEDIDVSLLGLPEESDWILNAPYIDKSFMRNVLIFKLSRDMGTYAPRTRFVEVVLNGTYQGIYVLIEKIKRNKARVDISKLTPDENTGDDLTGGYIIKIDKPDDDYFESTYPPPGNPNRIIQYQYEYPKDDDISDEQKAYIQNFIFEFEDVMASPDYANPMDGYLSYIDMHSFIDYMLLNELSKNVDGYRLSTFLHKDKDSKNGRLKMGPIWDFDLAFGNANYYGATGYTDWQIKLLKRGAACDDTYQVPFWWYVLLQDSTFIAETNARWLELRQTVWNTEAILNYIDSVADTLNEAQARNFEIWAPPGVFGGGFWPVPVIFYTFSTYQDEIDYLKEWIQNRLNWMDENLPLLDSDIIYITQTQGYRPAGFSLEQNFPNPFNQQTYISYQLSTDTHVRLDIVDIRGRLVETVIDEWQWARYYTLKLDGTHLPSGIYYYQLRTEQYTDTKRMMLIK